MLVREPCRKIVPLLAPILAPTVLGPCLRAADNAGKRSAASAGQLKVVAIAGNFHLPDLEHHSLKATISQGDYLSG